MIRKSTLLALYLMLGVFVVNLPALAQQKWSEGAGVARAEPGEGKTGPGRQAALQAALAEAVQNVAVEMLTESETVAGKPPPDPNALRERAIKALGGDPSVYISRYQIREDRGVQPRLLLADPDAKAEYQLVVVAQVDTAKVRQRVGARAPAATPPEGAPPVSKTTPEGMPTAAGPAGPSSFDLEIEQLTSYQDYTAVRTALLEKVGAGRAAPLEFGRGRAVLAVDAPISAAELPAALNKALAGQLTVETVPLAPGVAPDGRVRIRVKPLAMAIPTTAPPPATPSSKAAPAPALPATPAAKPTPAQPTPARLTP